MTPEVPFKPRLDILPSGQRRLWDEFAEIPSEFVLYDAPRWRYGSVIASRSILIFSVAGNSCRAN